MPAVREKTRDKTFQQFSGGNQPSRDLLKKRLPEWGVLESLLQDLGPEGETHFLGFTKTEKYELPLVAMSFGSKDPAAPVLGLFGGVHGLERIGAQVVLAMMKSFAELLQWDSLTRSVLGQIRIVFFPMVNPIGMLEVRRSNPNGVDLMRNSPTLGENISKHSFVGGQTLSPKLPWFRGYEKMENESQALVDFCKAQFFQSKAVITVDFHSGFGIQDRLWFPYAKTKRPFPHLPEMMALTQNLDRTYPNHFYKVEPQALNYTTHGDLWDFLYDEFCAQNTGTYLPLCLEMGSWMWIKKNPLQLFSRLGPFNPIKPHRHKRILRRHMTLFDYLLKATVSHQTWSGLNPEQKNKFQERANQHWYPTLSQENS